MSSLSQLDRLTGLKNLRVRGLAKVSFAAYLKAAGINIIRAAAFRKWENDDPGAYTNVLSSWYCAVKERLHLFATALLRTCRPRCPSMRFAALYAV